MKRALAAFILLILAASSALAQGDSTWTIRLQYLQESHAHGGLLPRKELARPRVGLALSGGGARGFAHIGVLKALTAAGIPIDMVAGTSMGCVIGGLYAAGHQPEDLENIANQIDWSQIFIDDPSRASLFLTQKQDEYRSLLRLRFGGWKLDFPSGLTAAQKLSDLLADLTMAASYRAAGDFDNLNIPFRAVVTDMVSGQSLAIGEGDLGEALRAGLAVPLIFTPVEKDTMLLADGGLLNNIPVDVIRDLGADVVVAVDVSSPLSTREQLEMPWALAEQIISIMMQEPVRNSLLKADVVITPDLRGHHAIEYSHIDEVIAAGEEAGQLAVEAIRQLLLDFKQEQGDSVSYLLTSVEVMGDSGEISDTSAAPPFRSGDIIQQGQVREYLREQYQQGIYEDVWATLEKEQEGVRLTIHLQLMPVFSGYRLEGNTLFSSQELLLDTDLEPGHPVNQLLADQDLKTVLNRYHSQGYALARFKEVGLDPQAGSIFGVIDEGIVEAVRYKGNDKTKRWVLSREFALRQGDIFNLRRAQNGIRNIYGTNLFERVSMEIQRGSQGAVLVVRVKEKGSISLGLGFQYDLEREAEAFALLAEDNLLGVGSKLSLYYQLGKHRQKAQLGLKADRIFKTYLTFNINGYLAQRDWKVYANDKEEGEYREDRRGGRFFLGQQIRRFGMLSVEGRLETVRLTSRFGQGYPTGRGEIRSFLLRSRMDTLDRFPFPTLGHAHSIYVEIGEPILGGTEEFRKTFASLESYITGWRWHTVFVKGSLGVSESPLPFSEQFRLGGEETLYGFREGELMGNKLFLLNLGYRLELVRRFYFGVRYDVGNVWDYELQIKWKTTKHAVGVSLALDTLLGPLTLTYGRANEGQERGYFTAGFQF